ncbi:hypothetical protein GXW74_13840 [Roseomonas eburnea]|uniref:Glycosyltransferase family 2 protein n=1 Tax=Neoroseomonas eburnea TaxID=1346889 RepID=A0A9X9XCY7_9PROT|nr:hypothetical protein [Neoroseomonas eburnea]MBR0681573.1 hypothetical protein [Neoroseomonas eburnea]
MMDVAPPKLVHRPCPDSGCWEHATFAAWLLGALRPRRCAGSGDAFAMLRCLAAQGGHDTEFEEAAAEPAGDAELIVLEAAAGECDSRGIGKPWRGAVRPGAILLLHGAPPETWRESMLDGPARHLSAGRGLAVLRGPGASEPAILWSLSPAAFQRAAERCAAVNAAWLAAQRLAEAEVANEMLRRRLDRQEQLSVRSRVAPHPPRPVPPGPAGSEVYNVTRDLADLLRQWARRLPPWVRSPLRRGLVGFIHLTRGEIRPPARSFLRRRRDFAVLRDSGFFDAEWYSARHPEIASSGLHPLAHFLRFGIRTQDEVSPRFDGAWYLAQNPDLRDSAEHPLLHYLRYGRAEGRAIRPHAPPEDAAVAEERRRAVERRLGLHLARATLFPVTIGMVVPAGMEATSLRRAVAAATAGLERIGQVEAGRILVLGLGERLHPAMLAEWPAAIVPLRQGLSPAAAHNRLMDMAFGQGAEIHLTLSAAGLLHPDAIAAMVRMLRAAGRQALVGARRASEPNGGGETFEVPWLSSPCIAIPKGVHAAIGAFDTRFAAQGADIDLSWRARARGYELLLCPSALFQDTSAPPMPTEALQASYLLARKWGDTGAAHAAAQDLERIGAPLPDGSPEVEPAVPGIACFEFDLAGLRSPW